MFRAVVFCLGKRSWGKRSCDGIICGHIHTPEDKQMGDVHYLNSGDWVESLAAIVECHDGRMELSDNETFMAGRAPELREVILAGDRHIAPDPGMLVTE